MRAEDGGQTRDRRHNAGSALAGPIGNGVTRASSAGIAISKPANPQSAAMWVTRSPVPASMGRINNPSPASTNPNRGYRSVTTSFFAVG